MEQRQYWKILLFMKRRPGMSVEDFRDYYETRHVPLCMTYMAGVARYVRRYLEPQPSPGTGRADELPYDVITELWFDTEAVWAATLQHITTTVLADEIIADEANLFDRPAMRIATIVEHETPLSGTGG